MIKYTAKLMQFYVKQDKRKLVLLRWTLGQCGVYWNDYNAIETVVEFGNGIW